MISFLKKIALRLTFKLNVIKKMDWNQMNIDLKLRANTLNKIYLILSHMNLA